MNTAAVVLLVEGNAKHAQDVSQALARRAVGQIVHARSAEEAIFWVSGHNCAVCVLDYQLPDIDGIEAMLRLRQRRPNLPIIMTSNARSEDVAIAAFHAGVVDYIPKKSGYVDVVAATVQQCRESATSRTAAQHVVVPSNVPEQLLWPTYQNRLRVIGRQLDLYGYRYVNLSQVMGGFHVRAVLPMTRAPEALEFTDQDLLQMMANAVAARGEGKRDHPNPPLLPTGYEDFLRALGYQLDERKAEAVTITELDEFVAVGGVALLDASGNATIQPFNDILRKDDIDYLLEEAFRRRQPGKNAGFTRLFKR